MFNYNFCRFAEGKKKYDCNRCNNCEKTCPTVSNILYGKIIKLPIIKQIYVIIQYIKYKIEIKNFKKNYISDYETTTEKFIWGIKSHDDLNNKNTCLFTMNDINLIYLKDENKYILGIETFYLFNNEDGEKKYIKQLLDRFTEWMIKNNYDTNKSISWYELFSFFNGTGISHKFDTIEDCYAVFKTFVNGYCSE